MPLGLFGGDRRRAQTSQQNQEKEMRTPLQCGHEVVTIDKKLAEGGFAIVYRVLNRRGRVYALKRQFISEEGRQLEACKRECQIVASLGGHKNIVSYVAHSISQNSEGVYQYMLLTQYYPTSVLSLMNDRLMNGRCLLEKEIMAIFCDMCEAVSRLHHSQTPVIHRDLKVENILIDNAGGQTNFVLCDFGSATTRILSINQYPYSLVEEEVLKYTTLSYRAPEMVDIYAAKPISTKSDIWALGVMLFKLCYFSLPFAESPLAIQNGTFTFPALPEYRVELRALIRYMLEPDHELRPDIFQVSQIAFQIAGFRCPVPNLNNVPAPNLQQLVQIVENFELKTAETSSDSTPVLSNQSEVSTTTVAPRVRPRAAIKPAWNTVDTPLAPNERTQHTMPQSASNPDLVKTAQPSLVKPQALPQGQMRRPQDLGFRDLEEPPAPNPFVGQSPFVPVEPPEGPLVSLSPPTQSQTTTTTKAGTLPAGMTASQAMAGHRRNVSDTSAVFANINNDNSNRPSAFKPYRSSQPESLDSSSTTQSATKATDLPVPEHAVSASTSPMAQGSTDQSRTMSAGDLSKRETVSETQSTHSWNPFIRAPYGDSQMDDQSFGARFDQLPRPRRVGSISSTSNVKSSESLVMTIDDKDPFGAAPFDPFKKCSQQTLQSSPSPVGGKPTPTQSVEGLDVYVTEPTPIVTTITNTIKSTGHRYRKLHDADDSGNDTGKLRPPHNDDDSDSVGSATDLQLKMQVSTTDDSAADQSDQEDRRFSYEHFDSDSKGSEERERQSQRLYETHPAVAVLTQESVEKPTAGDLNESGQRPLLDDDELELEPRELQNEPDATVPTDAVEMTVIPAAAKMRIAPTASVDEDMVISPISQNADTPCASNWSDTVTPQVESQMLTRLPAPPRPDDIFMNAPLRRTPDAARKTKKPVPEPLRLVVNSSPCQPVAPKIPPPTDAFGAVPLQTVVSPTQQQAPVVVKRTEIIQPIPSTSPKKTTFETQRPASEDSDDALSASSASYKKRKSKKQSKHSTDPEEIQVLAKPSSPSLQSSGSSKRKPKHKQMLGAFDNSSFQAEDLDSSPRELIQQS